MVVFLSEVFVSAKHVLEDYSVLRVEVDNIANLEFQN